MDGWPVANSSFRSPGFDFTGSMRELGEDMIARVPALRHIDLPVVGLSVAQTRKPVRHGLWASLTPLRFSGGAEVETRRGRPYTCQAVCDRSGRRLLYIMTFYLPRFVDLSQREKLATFIHELWHISPECNGDIRRHDGRCYAHTGSQEAYDAQVELLVDAWLQASPPDHLYEFLQHDFSTLCRIHGGVRGSRFPRPKIIPWTASAGH